MSSEESLLTDMIRGMSSERALLLSLGYTSRGRRDQGVHRRRGYSAFRITAGMDEEVKPF